MRKSLSEMEELKRFQGSTFDTIATRRLVEDRDTILEHIGKIQELQIEINCILNPWSSHMSEPIHSSSAGKNENQTPYQDQRCQSGPSARNSVILVREILQRIMGQTNNDCRFQMFILTFSPRKQRSLVGRKDSRPRFVLVHNFPRKLCIGSKKWRWLVQRMI